MKNKNSNSSPISDNITKTILESISDGVFTVDKNWRISSFNAAAEKITGIPREEAIGKQCCEVFRSNMCETDCALRRTMREGRPLVDSSTYIVNSEQRKIPVTVCTAVLKDENGKVIGGVESFRDMSLVEELRRELDSRHQIGDVISRSHAMQKIFQLLPRIAESDSTVVIQGETGTGKELMAQTIHDLSPRCDKPFVAINCGALPDTLLESELFGYKAGAFTDAKKDKPGHFAMAEGGTIFLDEIGDISAAFQVRLLRVLQERTYTPLGGTQPVTTDVRIIAAANKDIDKLVEEGTFRQDLFYRLNVMRMEMPPLRERKEDIPLLVDFFIERLNRLRNRAITGISQEALHLLMSYNFPGNIRELENIIEHAFIICPEGRIEPHCLPDTVRSASSTAMQGTMSDTVRSAEADAIREALKQNNYNRLAAARALGMHKSTLFRKIKKLGIELPEIDGRTQHEE